MSRIALFGALVILHISLSLILSIVAIVARAGPVGFIVAFVFSAAATASIALAATHRRQKRSYEILREVV